MDILPNEIIAHIFKFIPDRIYVSMVSKKWLNILDIMTVELINLYKNIPIHHITIERNNYIVLTHNDSYFLKKCYIANFIAILKK